MRRNNPLKNYRYLSIKIEPDLHVKLKFYCKKHDVSIQSLVRNLILEFLSKNE